VGPQLRGMVRASHFQPTLAVTAIASALALSTGRGLSTLAVATAVLAGQFSVGWSNDYLDRDRDRATGRTDKPIVAGDVSERLVRNGAITAAAVCVPLSMLSGWRAGLVHLVAVALAWAYNAGLKRTLVSVVPYALAFGLLPAFVTLGARDHPWSPAWATVAAALMGSGAHFVNTLADRDADAATGVRGLPQRLSAPGSLVTGALLMGTALGVLAVGPPGSPSAVTTVLLAVGAAALAGVIVAAVTARERTAWSLTLVVAATAVAALVVNGDALVPGP